MTLLVVPSAVWSNPVMVRVYPSRAIASRFVQYCCSEINQHVNLDMLKDKVLPLVDTLPGDEGVTLQQDGATAHTAKLVQAWCKDNFKSFWSKEL